MPHFIKSLSFALNGLKLVLKEKHFKIHLVLTLIVLSAGIYFHINKTEWLVLLICIGIVLSVETINTAFEYLIDFVEPNQNPKAGAIKDLSAGAVLIVSIISVIIAVMIFGKYIINLFTSV
jgi:diacylglycerol kinase (ATP)